MIIKAGPLHATFLLHSLSGFSSFIQTQQNLKLDVNNVTFYKSYVTFPTLTLLNFESSKSYYPGDQLSI